MVRTDAVESAGQFVVPGNRWDLVDDRDPEPPEISVIVPFYDNQRQLDFVLTGLSLQTHPAARTQVIIADDGSPEAPRIPDVATALDPLIVRQDDHGFRAAAARNLGVGHADGAVLVFLDQDTVPEPGYLARISRLPALLPDALVGGHRRHADLAGWTPSRLAAWLRGESGGPPDLGEPEWLVREYRGSDDLLRIGPRSYQHLIGAVLACSRALLDDIGGFDDTFVGYGGEDYDFTYRAHTAGAVFSYVPDAVAWHDGPDWSGRSDDVVAQRVQKNREIAELARRIPEPSMRGRGQFYEVCDVIVSVDVTGWSLGAGVVCLRSLLAAADSGVWLTGDGPALVALADWFAADPRVQLGAAPPAVADRARVKVVVIEPVRADPAFTATLRSLTDDDVGRITAGSTVLTSTRAHRRARRHALPLAELFPDLTVAPADAGLSPISEEPELSAVFGGWA